MKKWKVLLCGGGKNKILIDIIKKNCSKNYTMNSIDKHLLMEIL